MFVVSSILTVVLFLGSQANIVKSKNITELPEENSQQVFRTTDGTLETTFLGSFNTRLYFVGNESVSQYIARENCKSAGMALVTFTGQEDLSFVQSKLSKSNTFKYEYWFWMDVINVQINSCFISGGRSLSNIFSFNSFYNNIGRVGLVFSKWPSDLSVIQLSSAAGYPYVFGRNNMLFRSNTCQNVLKVCKT